MSLSGQFGVVFKCADKSHGKSLVSAMNELTGDALGETTANAEEISTEAADNATRHQISVDNFGDPVVVIDTDQNIWERHTYA